MVRERIYDQDFWLGMMPGGRSPKPCRRIFLRSAAAEPVAARAIRARRSDGPHAGIAAAAARPVLDGPFARGARPFLTHSFVDWALTIPPTSSSAAASENMCWAGDRAVAAEAGAEPAQARLPDAARRLVRRRLQRFARDAWRSSGAADAGFLDPGGSRRLFDEHRAGAANHGRLLYAIAMFSCWWSEQRYRSVSAGSLRLANGLSALALRWT